MSSVQNGSAGRRSAGRVICDLLMTLTALAVAAVVCLFFVTPVVEVGGKAVYGETQNVFTFIWFGENSAIRQFIGILEQMQNTEAASGGTMTFAMNYYSLFRLACLVIPSGILVLVAVINAVSVVFRFFTGRSDKLIEAVLGTLSQCLNTLFAFACFGAVDSGEGGFFAGYTLSWGFRLAVWAALSGLLVIALVRFCVSKKSCLYRFSTIEEGKNERRAWLRAFWLATGYTVIAAVLSLARLDYFCTETFYVWFNSVLISVMTGFDVTLFIVPVIFFVLSACLSCFVKKSQSGVVNSYKHLLAFGYSPIVYKKPPVIKGMGGAIVAAIICLVGAFVLCYPAWGFGLSVKVYYCFVAIFAAAAISQAFAALFTGK
ncbi:MAG: hypothetical protein ACI4MH_06695 [Candidatus Coproplasma sp.]